MTEFLDDINRVSYDLLISEPFWGQFFVGFVKSPTGNQHCVSLVPKDGFVFFSIEEEFWFKLDEKQKRGAIKHELLHLIYKHPLRLRNYLYRNIAYLASDLVVNQELESSELPRDAFTLESLGALGLSLEKEKSVDYYYRRLEKRLHRLTKIRAKARGMCSLTEEKASYDKQLQSLLKTNPSDSDFKQGLREIELLRLLEKRCSFNSHLSWETFRKNTEGNNRLIEHNVNRLLMDISNKLTVRNSWGKVSANLKGFLQAITLYDAEKVDWKRALQTFCSVQSKDLLKEHTR